MGKKTSAGKDRKRVKQATELVAAAIGGDAPTCDALLRAGADVAAQDAQGNHALGAAACGGHAAVVARLLAAARRSSEECHRHVAAVARRSYGHEDVLDR